MILVDSYDVVDAFKRLPKQDHKTFTDLKNKVKDVNSKKEVNYIINRWIKDFMNDVEDYYTNED
jgi:predicted DNA-binding protein